MINDGLKNLVSGMGTDRDKSVHTTYTLPTVDKAQYAYAYRGAWLPRKVVAQVSEDAFRKWRDWQAEPDQISAIEQREKALRAREKLQRAHTMARLFGRAFVYISVKGDEDRTEEPLNIDRVRRGSISFLQVLLDTEVAEGEIETDPLSPEYGEPKYYEISGTGALTRVHPSRMVIFYGAERPQDYIFGREADSVLTAALPAIKRHDATVANVAGLVFEARVDVITIPGLAELLQDSDTETSLLQRFALMAQMKGNNGLVMLNGTTTPGDPSEEWEQKNATFTTLPDIITKAQEEVSAAARIPRAILFGTGAGGLGATGDLELSAYYDHINTLQSTIIEPSMTILDECLIRDALGTRPPEIWYSWSSLWQMSDKEKAEIGSNIVKKWTEAAKIGAAEPIWQACVNELTEAGVGGGIEMFMNEWTEGGGADVEEPEDLK
jgi:uncharacterized protein